MVNVTELRPGNYFIDENNLYQVLDILLNKTAMRKMVAKVKVKNVRTGTINELARNSGYMVENVRLDKRQMQYLYDTGDFFVFMDQETYEQVEIPAERLQWEKQFLKGDEVVEITSYDGEILGVNLPAKVTLKITQCDPGVRGDTVNKPTKPATLETGLVVRVPLFIEEGEEVLVRTDNGEYDGRAQQVQSMLDWWQGLLLFIGGLLVGGVAAFFITRYLFQKQLRENPPVNEKMIRAMFRSMGRTPSEKQIREIMRNMNQK